MTWSNTQPSCMLCEMDKRTKWYKETDDVIIANNLSGRPFVVWKDHKKEISEDEKRIVKEEVSTLFDEFDLAVRMNLVRDHWHAHLVTDNKIDLSRE